MMLMVNMICCKVSFVVNMVFFKGKVKGIVKEKLFIYMVLICGEVGF